MKAVCGLLLVWLCTSAQGASAPLIVEGNAPIVELEFQTPSGSPRMARFLIDTGGGAFILGSKLMADIGAQPTGPASKEDGFVPLRPMAAKLGGMELNLSDAEPCGKPDSQWLDSRNEREGLIPGQLLRHYDMVLDYPGRRFTLSSPGTSRPQGVEFNTPISSPSGFPRIEAEIGGKSYGFLLDTGASFTMISQTAMEEWAKENPAWPSADGAVGFANMFGGKVDGAALMLRVAKLKLGPIALTGVAAVSRPDGIFEQWMSSMMTAPIVGSIGGNVLRDFRVEIDYAAGKTYLSQSGTSVDEDLVSVGLVLLAKQGESPVISAVSSNAAPDVKAGVHVGDTLLAVDDVVLAGKPLAAAALQLQGKAGTSKRLKLMRDGKAVTVTVTVKDLL
jgi:predicted aspartyl protease